MKIKSILGIMLISLLLSIAIAATSSTSVADNTPPSLLSLSFGPRVIYENSGPQNITFTARLKDDLSGISDGEMDGVAIIPSHARFYSESGNDYLTVEFRAPSNDPKFNSSNLVSGNNMNGIYVSNMVVPSNAELGNWTLDYFKVIDKAGNERTYEQDQIFMMGYPIVFYVE